MKKTTKKTAKKKTSAIDQACAKEMKTFGFIIFAHHTFFIAGAIIFPFPFLWISPVAIYSFWKN